MGSFWSEPDYEPKILVVGNYSKFSNHLTHLAEKSYDIDGSTVKATISYAESEQGLKTLSPSYYNRFHGIIIAYDLTDQASFDHAKRWLEKINRHAPVNICKLLVGAKGSISDRTIDYNTGKTYADQLKIPFAEMPDIIPENITEVFEKIVDDVLSNIKRQREQFERERQKIMQQQQEERENSEKESSENKN